MKVWSKFGVLVGTLSVVLRQKSSNYETFLGLNFLFFLIFQMNFKPTPGQVHLLLGSSPTS